MIENPIIISNLNDFIFCPISIYFHKIYGEQDKIVMQETKQINGTFVHKYIDNYQYSNNNFLQGIDIFSNTYGIVGKIDIYDKKKFELIERKKHINIIYDGYIFQLYAQYFAMIEMGYKVDKLSLYSYDNNKKYNVKMPFEDKNKFNQFENLIYDMHHFNINNFKPLNKDKCLNCIYSDLCDRDLSNA